MRSIIFIAALTALAGQTPQDNNAPVNPREIAFEHDGRNVSAFVGYFQRDSDAPLRVVLNRLNRDSRGTYHLSLESLPDGVYTVQIAAINRAGESPRVSTVPPKFVVAKGRRGPIPIDLRDTSPGLFKRMWAAVVGADSDEPAQKP